MDQSQRRSDGNNVFEGGFLGLDNISVFDRSIRCRPAMRSSRLTPAWLMAMFALNMTVIALELATEDSDYEAIAIQIYKQFLANVYITGGQSGQHVPLWDPEAGFSKIW